ncbi:MAG: SIMPL domain-containing protein [Treponema sp.]
MDERKKVLKVLFIGYITVFLMLLFIMYLIIFQNGNGSISNVGHVSLSGVATINVAPDVANVSFDLSTREKTAQAAKEANDNMLRKLNEVLEKYEIKKTELSMNYINIRPFYEYRENTNELAGYVAQKTITIKIKEIEKYNAFIDDLLKAGISNINSVDFVLEDIKTVKNQARVKALEAAREKAELFATSISKKIVDVIEISEDDSSIRYSQSNYKNVLRNSYMDMKASSGGADETGIKEERGNIAVSASVSAVFVMQ